MILITRPLEEAHSLADQLGQFAIPSLVYPLLHIQPLIPCIPAVPLQAVILTSFHGLQAFQALALRPPLLFAVGLKTIQNLSFKGKIHLSPRGYAGLIPLLKENLDPQGAGVLYLSGRHITHDFQHDVMGLPYYRAIGYDAQAVTALSSSVQTALCQGDLKGVTFFSQRTLHIFHSLALPFVKDFSKLVAYCSSHSLARAAKILGFNRCCVTQQPTSSHMAHLISQTYNRDLLP